MPILRAAGWPAGVFSTHWIYNCDDGVGPSGYVVTTSFSARMDSEREPLRLVRSNRFIRKFYGCQIAWRFPLEKVRVPKFPFHQSVRQSCVPLPHGVRRSLNRRALKQVL